MLCSFRAGRHSMYLFTLNRPSEYFSGKQSPRKMKGQVQTLQITWLAQGHPHK